MKRGFQKVPAILAFKRVLYSLKAFSLISFEKSMRGGFKMKGLYTGFVFLLAFVWGCGYGMHYTKSTFPVPRNVSAIKVMDVKDIKVKTRQNEVSSGKTEYIKNILINELLLTKKFEITDDAEYALYVKIDGYRAGYRKYIALSAKIVEIETNKMLWGSSISGISKKYIDDVIRNTVKELVTEMAR